MPPEMLMQCRADQDLAARRAGAIARRPIGGFADDRQLHPVVRPDEPVQYLAAVNPDPDRARPLPAPPAAVADLDHCRLPRQRRAPCLLVPPRVRPRTAEDRPDAVP